MICLGSEENQILQGDAFDEELAFSLLLMSSKSRHQKIIIEVEGKIKCFFTQMYIQPRTPIADLSVDFRIAVF